MLVMDRVKELDRTVLVKRRKRDGQKKEEGLQVRRINDHFRSGGGSQLTKRKRKTRNGEPEKNKIKKIFSRIYNLILCVGGKFVVSAISHIKCKIAGLVLVQCILNLSKSVAIPIL